MNQEQNGLLAKIIAGLALIFAGLSVWRFIEAFNIQKKIDEYYMMVEGLPRRLVDNPRDMGAPSVFAQWGLPIIFLLVALAAGLIAVKMLKRN